MPKSHIYLFSGVISLSVHPTSKLALSVGADNVLRTWNLVKGRQAYAVNLSKKCTTGRTINIVKWSRNGNLYVVCIGPVAEVYSVQTAGVVYEVQASSKISSIHFSKVSNLQKYLDHSFCHTSRTKCFVVFKCLN